MRLKAEVLVLCSLLFMAANVNASPRGPLKLDEVRQQQTEIRADATARTGLYKDMPAATRDELFTKQNMVLSIIEGKDLASDLNESDKMKVFNALEWIEAAINKAEDERVVCERRAQIGTNRKERVCRTVAQIRADREAAQRDMMRSEINTDR